MAVRASIIVMALVWLALPGTAFAACTNPAGVAGEIVYNETHDVMQYCDDANWIRMGSKVDDAGAPAATLVAHWKLNEGAGSGAFDASGNNYTGTLTTPVWTSDSITGGQALDFNGTSDYVSLPMAAATASVADEKFTWALWVKADVLNAEQIIITATNDNGMGDGEMYGEIMISSTSFFQFRTDTVTIASAAATAGWHHLAGVKDGGNKYLYVDGALAATTTAANVATEGPTVFQLGKPATGVRYFNGKMDDVRIYDDALSSGQIAALYNATKPANTASGLVGHWKLDEGTGASTADATGTASAATINGATWTTDGTTGDQSLRFNGTTDDVVVPHHAGLDLPNSHTIMAWIKADTVSGGYRTFLNKPGPAHANYYMEINNDELGGGFYDGGTTSFHIHETTTLNLLAGRWYHAAAVFDTDANTYRLYVNGQQVYSGTETGTPVTGVASLNIGVVSGDLQTWDGLIDDVRVYNRPLTASEIEAIYQEDAAKAVSGNLLAHWKMNEGAGGTTADATGNGETGTITGATWTADSITGGQALSFDGTSDFIAVDQNWKGTLQSTTVSMWIKPDFSAARHSLFFELHGDNMYARSSIDTASGDIRLQFRIAGVSELRTINADLQPGIWQHVVITLDQAGGNIAKAYVDGRLTDTQDFPDGAIDNSAAQTMMIGHDDDLNEWYDGLMDDVRIYDRALTAAEVAALYNAAYPPDVNKGLVLHWPFDESSGTTAQDSSGNGNNGILTAMETATDWIPGKLGNALVFDGSEGVLGPDTIDDDVQTAVSVTAWAYIPSLPGAWQSIVHKDILTAQVSFSLGISSSNQIDWRIDSTPANFTLTAGHTNRWVFLAGTWDGATSRLYVDGVQQASAAYSGAMPLGIEKLSVGCREEHGDFVCDNQSFIGRIDDLRIYNRAISAAEVAALYNAGAGYAACTNPTGPEGAIVYNDTQKQMQFCDGGQWVSMKPPGVLATGETDLTDMAGYWKFDETSGTTAADELGTSNGSLFGNAGWTASGKIDGALTLDGSGDYLNAGSHSSIDNIFSGGGTIMAWVYPETSGEFSNGRIADKGNETYNGWTLLMWDGAGRIAFKQSYDGSGITDWATTNPIPFNAWTHVAVVYNSSTTSPPTFYINGATVAQQTHVRGGTTSNSDAAKDLLIGAREGPARWFDGQIDDLRLYDRALSAAEILDIYNAATAPATVCANPAGSAGELIYNTPHSIMQYCDGGQWVGIKGHSAP